QLTFVLLAVEFLDARSVRMDRDEGVKDVDGDVDGFTVAQLALAGGVLVERLTVDVLGDEVPIAGVGLAGPEDLHHVGVMDLAKRADFPADRLVAGGVVEELEGTLLALDLVTNPVDGGVPALAEHVEYLEA